MEIIYQIMVRNLTGKGLKRTVRINAAVEAAGQIALMWKKMLWKEPVFVSRKMVVIWGMLFFTHNTEKIH